MFISLRHYEKKKSSVLGVRSSCLKCRSYKSVIFRCFFCLIITQKESVIDHRRGIKQISCKTANYVPKLFFLLQVLGVFSLGGCTLLQFKKTPLLGEKVTSGHQPIFDLVCTAILMNLLFSPFWPILLNDHLQLVYVSNLSIIYNLAEMIIILATSAF